MNGPLVLLIVFTLGLLVCAIHENIADRTMPLHRLVNLAVARFQIWQLGRRARRLQAEGEALRKEQILLQIERGNLR